MKHAKNRKKKHNVRPPEAALVTGIDMHGSGPALSMSLVSFVLLCAAAFAVLMSLPTLFHGIREGPFISYKIMWLDFCGHRFSLPPETPKPLFAALCGLLWQGALYPVMCACTVGVLAYLMKLAVHFGAPWWAGLLAFFLFLTANGTVLPEFVMSAYYPMLYFLLLLGGVYSFVKTRQVSAALFLLGAGLMRPEAWAVPVLLMLLTRFKKQRGFSWWLFLPLLAPPLWMLFDWRISGSATYSADVTQDYAAALGIAATTFGGYWPATVKNVFASFNPPVHLFGLACLIFMMNKTRKTDHFLMGACTALPFFIFWALSVDKPVVVHVRFLSFPMLLCCLYAAIVPALFIRKKLLLAPAMAVLACAGFHTDLYKKILTKVREDSEIVDARNKTCEAVRKLEKKAEVILCGRSVGYFSYTLGENVSHKTFMFREIAANDAPVQCINRGVAVYIRNDLGGGDVVFSSLMVPRKYRIGPFGFIPVFATANNTGIVYVFERMSDHPPPPQCGGRQQ